MKTWMAIGVLCFWLPAASISAAAGSSQGFEDGWKWFKHRKAQNAQAGELLHILNTLKSKYDGFGLDMSGVDAELRRYSQAPVSSQAGYDDGWKWYRHRKAGRAPQKELTDILRTLLRKYAGTGVDVSGTEKELARYESGASASAPPAPARPAPADPRLNKALADLKHPDPKVRLKTVQALKESRDPLAVAALVQTLDDPDNFVAIVAASALAQIGKPSLAPLMTAADSEKENVRIVACLALGDLGDPAAVPVLERRSKEKGGEVREAAKNALKKIRSKTSPKPWTPN